MWFIGVEAEQQTSAPPPKKNPGSAPASPLHYLIAWHRLSQQCLMCSVIDSVEQQLHIGFNFLEKKVNLSRLLYDYRHVICRSVR